MSVAVVLKGYPRLSETFIAQEIYTLEREGIELQLVSLRHPTDPHTHPIHSKIQSPVNYLPEYLYQEPVRVWHSWRIARQFAGYHRARQIWLADLKRDFSVNRIRRFGQSMVLAAELSKKTKHLYAHFLHTPASVTRYAATIRRLPWSFSAHAKDIWTTPKWEKTEKLADCTWAVTCTENGYQHLAALANEGGHLHRLYHGLDRDLFSDPGPIASDRDGSDPDLPVRMLSVGRAVPKKGFDVLLRALAQLPGEIHWQWRHAGGGEQLHSLKAIAAELGLAQHIQWLGPLPSEQILHWYRDSDLFVLPSRITPSGDRDGLPNVLMEAASQRLASISCALPGIQEFIETEHQGLLVPADDATMLSGAIHRAVTHPALRRQLGLAALQRLSEDFDHASNIKPLLALLSSASKSR